MNILYIGDIMAEPGIEIVQRLLPGLRREHNLDIVIAQAENVTGGKSMSLIDMKRLQKIGIDFFTGGNHTPRREELYEALEDPSQPVIGPANMHGSPGPGYKYLQTPKGRVLVVSLLGRTVGSSIPDTDNPLLAIDAILIEAKMPGVVATVVNFHGDFSSEKVIIGHYLDGRVSMVVGDHWHVPTADARLLPKGTAHMTDVGMCGTLNSSLGVSFDSVIPRWRDGHVTKNEIETTGPTQFNAALVDVDTQTGLAKSIQHIRIVE
jgi:metallophosphoesterase (TIGR00282 family)